VHKLHNEGCGMIRCCHAWSMDSEGHDVGLSKDRWSFCMKFLSLTYTTVRIAELALGIQSITERSGTDRFG